VLEAYTDKSLDLAGARSLAAISGQFLDNVRRSSKTSAADLLWGQSLDDEADLYAILGNNAQSLAVAKRAKDVAQSLTQSNPSAQEPLQLLYDASMRVGDALVALGAAHKQDALKEYNAAVGIAEKIVSLSGDEGGDKDVIDAHMKIGDVYKDNELKQYSEARREYQVGLATCLAALTKHPDSFNLLRDKGKAVFRIAELLRTEKTAGTSDEARAFYRDASEVQNGLVSRNAKEALAAQKAPDSSLKSNLAATYTHWGLLEKGDGNLEAALEKLRQGVVLDEELTKNEPGNPLWQEFLTPNYLYLAETLEGVKRPDEALTYYRKFADARRMLAYRGPGRPTAQKELAEATKLLGDRSAGLAQIEAYREAVRIWNRLVEDPRIADVAADQYDVVLGFAHAFDAKRDWPDAQAAYRVAMKVAVLNYVKDPSDTSWRDKAEIAERASVEAGKAAETAPADGTH
jgi:tetratricopeptide (TPR) repeat protein